MAHLSETEPDQSKLIYLQPVQPKKMLLVPEDEWLTTQKELSILRSQMDEVRERLAEVQEIIGWDDHPLVRRFMHFNEWLPTKASIAWCVVTLGPGLVAPVISHFIPELQTPLAIIGGVSFGAGVTYTGRKTERFTRNHFIEKFRNSIRQTDTESL
jgi:hypothetical protein